jgi:hypothetical protein
MGFLEFVLFSVEFEHSLLVNIRKDAITLLT